MSYLKRLRIRQLKRCGNFFWSLRSSPSCTFYVMQDCGVVEVVVDGLGVVDAQMKCWCLEALVRLATILESLDDMVIDDIQKAALLNDSFGIFNQWYW